MSKIQPKHSTHLGFLVLAALILVAGVSAYRTISLPYHAIVPITLSPVNTVIVHPTVDGHPLDMFLNLGRSNIQAQGLDKNMFAAGVTSWGYQVREATVRLGTYAKTCQMDIEKEPSHAGASGGTLGYGVFDSVDPSETTRVTLDLRANTLTVDWFPSRPRLRPSPRAIVLPFREGGIEVQVNGHVSAHLALCTCAPTTSLPWSVAQQLLSKRDRAQLLDPSVADVLKRASLSQSQPPIVTVPAMIGIGTRTWKVNCLTMADWKDTCLGMDVLKDFRIIIDYRDAMVYLEPYD